MDARESWSESALARVAVTASPFSLNFGLYLFLISFTSLFYVSNAPLLLGHYDLGWHLAAGDLIRDRGSIPLQDPWSFTLGDKRWFNLSWLWDVIASAVLQYTGLSGLVLLAVGCGAAIAGYLTSLCLGSGASALATCTAVFFASLLYPAYEASPNMYLAVAPNTCTMVLCVFFYRECVRRTRWLLLPPMMALWANLHGGFLLGFLIIGLFCGTALLRRAWIDLRIYAFAAIGCLVATLVNPLGWRIYEGVAATLGHFVQGNIGEWLPYAHNMEMPGSLPGMIYMVTFVALELRHRNSNPIPFEPRLLSWLFLLMGLYQFRYISFFFIFSTIPVALHLDRLLPERLSKIDLSGSLLAAGIIGVCALPIVFLRVEPALGLSQMLSDEDARYLKEHVSHARLLNHWNVGGILIYRTRGTVPVFVDGRAATAYPDELLRDYFRLVREEIDEAALDAILEKYRIDAVLWVKAHEQLRRFLVEKRGWKETYAGSYESLYVKP